MPELLANVSPPAVEVITDEAALPRLAAEWDALLSDEGPGAVFRSPAWLLPWWNTFSVAARARGRPLALRLFIARRGPRLRRLAQDAAARRRTTAVAPPSLARAAGRLPSRDRRGAGAHRRGDGRAVPRARGALGRRGRLRRHRGRDREALPPRRR